MLYSLIFLHYYKEINKDQFRPKKKVVIVEPPIENVEEYEVTKPTYRNRT
jgi:hypothetical protein